MAATVMNMAPTAFGANLAVSIVGASQLAKTVNPPANIIDAAKKQKAKYVEKSAALATSTAQLDAEIALVAAWATGTPAEQARYLEMTTKRAAQVEYKAWLDAEVTRLADAIALAGG